MIKSLRRKDLEGNAEIVACELRPGSRGKILAIIFYRPPDIDDDDYLKELKKSLRRASEVDFDQIFLCGDVNLPNINWSTGTANSGDPTYVICSPSYSKIICGKWSAFPQGATIF